MFLSVKWVASKVITNWSVCVWVCKCSSNQHATLNAYMSKCMLCMRAGFDGAKNLGWGHQSFCQQAKYQNKFRSEYYLVWLIDFRRAFVTADIILLLYYGCAATLIATQNWKTHFNVSLVPRPPLFAIQKTEETHTNSQPMENCFAFHFSTYTHTHTHTSGP